MSQAIDTGVSKLPTSASPPRLLIVDDEQHMCDVCARTLQRAGYEVMATSDPHAAIAAFDSGQRFDLLLTDIKMPTMSGLDLARIAREKDPEIAIIIMTGYASLENLHQSVRRGVADFLAKPFELEQLRLAVDQALHKRAIQQDNLRLRTLEQLLVVSEALSATLELPELVQIALNAMIERSGFPIGFLLLGDEHETLHQAAAQPKHAHLTEEGRALAERAFVLCQAISEHTGRYGTCDDRALRAAFAVPLRAQGRINGVVVLCEEQPTTLRPGVQQGLMLLANHAGAALRNAILYRQLDEAYQRRQELDRLKSEFIAIASHELRTPLSIVLGYTMMVRDQVDGSQRDYLQRVLESAQRIKEIVDDMVNLRHIDTGEAQPQLAPLDLISVVQQAVENLRGAAELSGQTIVTRLPEALPPFLTDREKVLLVLNHLLSNAIKFTPAKGRITITVSIRPYADLEALQDATIIKPSPQLRALPWVVVDVQDTGIGIPAREQTRIFDRFYQVGNSLTRERGGVGLGLALVRELIASLGGAVWVVRPGRRRQHLLVRAPVPSDLI
ncbi:MAG: response regulator [Roseiflexaceae bacterium]|nr:response regulator [Roseiflexaceae bacterium]